MQKRCFVNNSMLAGRGSCIINVRALVVPRFGPEAHKIDMKLDRQCDLFIWTLCENDPNKTAAKHTVTIGLSRSYRKPLKSMHHPICVYRNSDKNRQRAVWRGRENVGNSREYEVLHRLTIPILAFLGLCKQLVIKPKLSKAVANVLLYRWTVAGICVLPVPLTNGTST